MSMWKHLETLPIVIIYSTYDCADSPVVCQLLRHRPCDFFSALFWRSTFAFRRNPFSHCCPGAGCVVLPDSSFVSPPKCIPISIVRNMLPLLVRAPASVATKQQTVTHSSLPHPHSTRLSLALSLAGTNICRRGYRDQDSSLATICRNQVVNKRSHVRAKD